MNIPDTINGSFEMIGGVLCCINCKPELVNKFYNKIGKESPLHD